MTTTPGSSRRPRVPPHSIEAEESVLGAMLLSESSISDVLEKIRRGRLLQAGPPPDLRRCRVAVRPRRGDRLGHRRRGAPADGRRSRRSAASRTSSTSSTRFPRRRNASYYARIVEETALLRRLIEATQEAAAMAFESGRGRRPHRRPGRAAHLLRRREATRRQLHAHPRPAARAARARRGAPGAGCERHRRAHGVRRPRQPDERAAAVEPDHRRRSSELREDVARAEHRAAGGDRPRRPRRDLLARDVAARSSSSVSCAPRRSST